MEKVGMLKNRFWLLMAVVFLFGVTLSAGCGSNETATQEKPREVVLEEFIKSLPALKGNVPGTQKPRLKDLTINNAGVIINYYQEVNGPVDKTVVSKNFRDFLKPFNKRQDLIKIYVNQWVTEKDSKGNEKDKIIGSLQLSQLKLNNINFNNFDYMTWQDIADVWYLDPSIDK